MIRIIMIMAGCLSLTMANLAQAQVIQAGTTYSGGGQLELPGSGATFTVPRGWFGQYDSREKLFNMNSPDGQKITVGYKAQSYADAIAEAKQPITTSDGVVMYPDLSNIIPLQAGFRGKAFTYSGKALRFMNVGAVVLVIKMPSGKALTVSSGGLGQNYEAFGDTLGWVMPSLSFAGESRQAQRSSSTRQADINKLRRDHNRLLKKAELEVAKMEQKLAKKPHVNRPESGKNAKRNVQVKESRGIPFGAYGTREFPPYVNHWHKGLKLWKGGLKAKSSYSSVINITNFVDKSETIKVYFCAKSFDETYRGTFHVQKKINGEWKYIEEGNYQAFYTRANEVRSSGADDVMFLDRSHGPSETVRLNMIGEQGDNYFWDTTITLNGIKFVSNGVAEYCSSESYGGKYDLFSSASDEQYNRLRRGGSSSGSYDTHFGTTSDGKMIFSAPGVSGCAGC